MATPATFPSNEVLQCASSLLRAGAGASSLEEVAAAVVHEVRDWFVDKATGMPVLPLVRFYVTSRWGDLEPELKDFALAVGTDARARADVICLTLLATAGEEARWNDRRASIGHKAIPLPSMEALKRLPMVARLVDQLGVDPHRLVAPDRVVIVEDTRRALDIFHVPEARDSPYVPDQEAFVIPYGVRSVVGLGGALADGHLFALLLFSSTPIPASALDAFTAMALSVKVALLTHADQPVFAGGAVDSERPQVAGGSPASDISRLETMNATYEQLLDARARVIDQELLRLDKEVAEAHRQLGELQASEAAARLREARKESVVEGALDCIIGMDAGGLIIEFNRAAETTFGVGRHDALGRPLAEVVIPYGMRERHAQGLSTYLETGEGPVIGRRIEVQALRADGTEFPVELAITRVEGSEPPLFNGYVRDITDRRRAAEELAAGRERLAHIARTLQTSLLPPELPRIGGYELAATFRALGDGYEVGGDFYDAFEVSDGRWGVVLGDVCGKGSEAAVVTALTRYTVRAAAMRSRDPAAVLRTLNEAIHRQHPDQFCTAAYATIDPTSGMVRLAVGGHPPPLVLSAGGGIEAVGIGGALLGPFEDWGGPTVTVTLGDGDLLLFYSDGVTEARSGSELFGDDRLRDVLRQSAGLTAAEVARVIEAAVLDFAGSLSDDLAILALRRLGGG